MEAVTLSVPDAIEGYARYMRGKRKRERSIDRFRNTLERAAGDLGWCKIDDLALAPVIDWLAGKVSAGLWSGTTHDAHVSALRGFGKFLHRAGHLPADPFEHLERSNETGEPGSRALRTAEIRAIIRASRARGRIDRRAKGNAALFWCFLAYTGLRHNEGAKCCWKDVDLERGCIVTDPAWSKNRHRQLIPIHPRLLSLLHDHRLTVHDTPAARVFPHVPNRNTWAKDREAAGVAYEDHRGRAATVHSLRKWCDTELDRLGVPIGVRRKIIRHAGGIDDRYLDHPSGAEALAVSGLPNLWDDEPCPGPLVDNLEFENAPGIVQLTGGEESIMSPRHACRDSDMATALKHKSDRAARPGNPQARVTANLRQVAGRASPSDLSTVIENDPAHSRSQVFGPRSAWLVGSAPQHPVSRQSGRQDPPPLEGSGREALAAEAGRAYIPATPPGCAGSTAGVPLDPITAPPQAPGVAGVASPAGSREAGHSQYARGLAPTRFGAEHEDTSRFGGEISGGAYDGGESAARTSDAHSRALDLIARSEHRTMQDQRAIRNLVFALKAAGLICLALAAGKLAIHLFTAQPEPEAPVIAAPTLRGVTP